MPTICPNNLFCLKKNQDFFERNPFSQSPLTDSKHHVVVVLIELAAIVQKPLRPELPGFRKHRRVVHDVVKVGENRRSGRNLVLFVRRFDVFVSVMRNAERRDAGEPQDLVNDGFSVVQVGSIIQPWKAVASAN